LKEKTVLYFSGSSGNVLTFTIGALTIVHSSLFDLVVKFYFIFWLGHNLYREKECTLK